MSNAEKWYRIFAAADDIQAKMELTWLREYKYTAWLRQKHEDALRKRILAGP
ncbi:MAG: hypothetical protein R3293_19535 [Candidatus Promineifilaceae bacterium]|nr:hypothetical protein [Candidatus Promineifilaceae bacterium]